MVRTIRNQIFHSQFGSKVFRMKKYFKFVLISLAFGVINAETILKEITVQSSNFLPEATSQIIKEFYSTKGSYYHTLRAVEASNKLLCDDIITDVSKNLKDFAFPTHIEDHLDLPKLIDHKRFSVVAFIDSIKSFNELLSRISSDRFKFRRHFTFVAIKSLQGHELEIIFDAMWKRFIKKVNIIMSSENGTTDLFAFSPFNEYKCGDTSPIKINTFDNDLMRWKHNVFHPAKTTNLFGCPVIIGCAVGTGEPYLMSRTKADGSEEILGIEKDIITEISKLLNFKPKFEIHGVYPGLMFENGTATGKQIKLHLHSL